MPGFQRIPYYTSLLIWIILPVILLAALSPSACGRCDTETALAQFHQAGGVAQWVDRQEGHLMIRRFNVEERCISLKYLPVIAEVKLLTLHGYDFDDNDLAELARWNHLKGLHLIHNHEVTDAGIKRLASLKRLKQLIMWENKVTDIETISKLPFLAVLEIDHCPVTDSGLLSVQQTPTLRKLLLSNTKVTQAALVQLRKSLPLCDIENID